MHISKQMTITAAALFCLLLGTGVAQAMQNIHLPNGQTVQGKILGGRLMIVGPDHKLHPADDGQYRNAAGQSIIIQGGRIAPGGVQAIGPKPDDPRLTRAIGPKPDDPLLTKAIGPKPDDPLLTKAIGPKPDDPRVTIPPSTTLQPSTSPVSNGGTNLSVAPSNTGISGAVVKPPSPAVVLVK
jgi:hypothetical protein